MMVGSIPDYEQAGEVKVGQVGIANLRVRTLDVARLADEMRDRVARAPNMFERSAVVVDFGGLLRAPDVDTARALFSALRNAGVMPVALAYGTREIEALSLELGVPLLAKFRAQYETSQENPSVSTAPAPSPVEPVAQVVNVVTSSQVSLMHTAPVRSGQQVYAQARDLVVSAAVGAGAEVISDGSIHIYGALRGRALAGAQGDEKARIFCKEFQAELVAIAGRYRVIEEIPQELRGKSVQVWLEGETLHITEIA